MEAVINKDRGNVPDVGSVEKLWGCFFYRASSVYAYPPLIFY